MGKLTELMGIIFFYMRRIFDQRKEFIRESSKTF